MLLEILLGLATIVLGIVLFLRRNYGKLEAMGVPVVPPSMWGLGSDPFMIHETRFLDLDMNNFKKYGKVWGSYSISEPWINVADPDLVKVRLLKMSMYVYPSLTIKSLLLYFRQLQLKVLIISHHITLNKLRKSLVILVK